MRIKRKHPVERDRIEEVPLLKPHAVWPRVDPLAIIERQPKRGPRVFPYLGDTVGFWFEKGTEGAGLKGNWQSIRAAAAAQCLVDVAY